jgi:CBS domain-containing protein
MRLITATDLMNPEVLTVREDLPVRELAAFLVDNEITGAPVVDDDGRLVGVVSLVDIAALASEDDSFGGAPADFFSHVVGMPEEDEVERLAEEVEDLRVRDIMSPEVYSVEEDATVSDIAMRMLRDHLHRLLVMREDEVLGIISTSDLLGLLVDVE